MTARPVVRAYVNDLGWTGVPIALARLLAWPGTRTAVDIHVVSRHDGPLRPVLEAAGITTVALEPELGRSRSALVAAGAAQYGWATAGTVVRDRAWRRRTRHLPTPDIVLVQGAGAWPVATALPPDGRPRLVVHLHELSTGLDRSLEPGAQRQLATADRVLVVSEPVAALARSLGVAPDRIATVPGTIDAAPTPSVDPKARPAVISMGESGWRKGTDRALAAAHVLHRLDPSVPWHWIGRDPQPGWGFAVGTALPLVHHAAGDQPWSVVASPSLLVVTSREDPLPLVALEAGGRGIPVVACQGAGGLDDLLADDRGWLVDGTDPSELATVVHAALQDPGERERRGARLHRHVLEHHRIDVVGPVWLDALLGRS